MMVSVQLFPGSPPAQVSEFGPKVERSKEGALYFRPGSVERITESEWSWIVKHKPTIASGLRLLTVAPVVRKVPKPVEPTPPLFAFEENTLKEIEPKAKESEFKTAKSDHEFRKKGRKKKKK